MVRLLRHASHSARGSLAAVALVVAACGETVSPAGPVAAEARLDPTERIVRLHVAIVELRDDPDASGTSIELSRADTWVARAEALARTHTDPGLRDLLLETAEGQVTMVRSHAALKKSTRALHDRDPRADVGSRVKIHDDEPDGGLATSASARPEPLTATTSTAVEVPKPARRDDMSETP